MAGVGLPGIALGFGAQTLVRDGINGLFILGENQYARGDIVTIAGVMGTVEDVTFRRTLLRDVDGVMYSVPNSAVIVAANYTRDFAKVRVTVPVAIAADLAHVRSVADDVGRQLALDPLYEDIVVTAPAYLRVDSVDANGVAVQVNGTVRPGSQMGGRGCTARTPPRSVPARRHQDALGMMRPKPAQTARVQRGRMCLRKPEVSDDFPSAGVRTVRVHQRLRRLLADFLAHMDVAHDVAARHQCRSDRDPAAPGAD